MNISGWTGLFGTPGIFHIYVKQPQVTAVSQPHQAEAPENRWELIRIRRQVVKLNEALEIIDPSRFKSRGRTVRISAAKATSASDLGDLATETAAVMTSTEEVNTTSTSFSTFGPIWTGSTAQATIGGDYDGSNGTMTLTFEVDREGTHGEDDLKIKVFDPDGNELEKIDIKKEDPIDKQYTLSNGLILTLSEGDLLKHEKFMVDVFDSDPTSFSPVEPEWSASTAMTNIDGVYDGSNGTMTLTFEVDREGTHGEDDLKIKVFDPDGTRTRENRHQKGRPDRQAVHTQQRPYSHPQRGRSPEGNHVHGRCF